MLFLIFKKQPDYFPNLIYYINSHNWTQSEKILEDIKTKQVKLDILTTFDLYVKVHKLSDIGNYPKGKDLREMMDIIEKLIVEKSDYKFYNSLTFAELSKAIFLSEDNKQQMLNAIKYLSEKPKTSQILQKQGELNLVLKDYKQARECLLEAKKISKNKTEIALINANIGNTYVGIGDIKNSIKYYSDAEQDYPSVRKFIYFSNFGYLLLLDNDLENAKDKIETALKIEPEDWYSYLNLGLIYDKQKDYREAINNFQKVIDKTNNNDSKREALIFKGRSLELNKENPEKYIKSYLNWLIKLYP